MTTTTSKALYFAKSAEPPAQSDKEVRYFEISGHRIPAGSVDIDDLVAEFEKDPKMAQAIEEGRRRVAANFYSDESHSVRALRLKKGWSQARLAEAVGSSQSHIARIEQGTEDVRLSTVSRIALALDCAPRVLIETMLLEKNHG